MIMVIDITCAVILSVTGSLRVPMRYELLPDSRVDDDIGIHIHR